MALTAIISTAKLSVKTGIMQLELVGQLACSTG